MARLIFVIRLLEFLFQAGEKRQRVYMGSYVLPLESEERSIRDSWLSRDNEAFEELYRRYSAPLKQFCRRRLVVAEDAEDACQESMIKAQKALDSFRPNGRLWPWLATIAANTCTDFNRSRAKIAGRVRESDEIGDPEEEANSHLRAEIVDQALFKLPKSYKAFLYLREFDGWTYEELARFHGTTVASVRSVLMRARRALASQVKQVARARGQWPLPSLLPLPFIRRMFAPSSEGSFMRRIAVRLRARSVTEAARLSASGLSMNAVGVLLATITAVGLLVTVANPIDIVEASEEDLSPAVASMENSNTGEAASESQPSEDLQINLSSKALADSAPELSAEVSAGAKREGERASVNAKLKSRLEGTPGAEASGDLYSFYCDADRINSSTCGVLDSIP